MAIIRNAVRCLSCHDIIESIHHHDYVTCKCGKISVDGGVSYLRRRYAGDYEELSIHDNDTGWEAD